MLNAGAIPGYEVTNVKMECGDKYIETDYEHYKEKEMLIVSILVNHQLLWFFHINFTFQDDSVKRGDECLLWADNKAYLAKSNTGLYQSSYTDKVQFWIIHLKVNNN